MNFSLSTLLAGFLFGVIGVWIIKEGRRVGNLRWPFIGLALLVYPYFSNNAWMDWIPGILLCALAYRLRDA